MTGFRFLLMVLRMWRGGIPGSMMRDGSSVRGSSGSGIGYMCMVIPQLGLTTESLTDGMVIPSFGLSKSY